MTQYLNEKLAGNINSEDSSKSTPKKKKGHSELLEKSPVTPPERKRQKKQVDKYDPVKQILYIDSLIFNNSYKKH